MVIEQQTDLELLEKICALALADHAGHHAGDSFRTRTQVAVGPVCGIVGGRMIGIRCSEHMNTSAHENPLEHPRTRAFTHRNIGTRTLTHEPTSPRVQTIRIDTTPHNGQTATDGETFKTTRPIEGNLPNNWLGHLAQHATLGVKDVQHPDCGDELVDDVGGVGAGMAEPAFAGRRQRLGSPGEGPGTNQSHLGTPRRSTVTVASKPRQNDGERERGVQVCGSVTLNPASAFYPLFGVHLSKALK